MYFCSFRHCIQTSNIVLDPVSILSLHYVSFIVLRVGGNVTNKAVTVHEMNKVKKMYRLANL